MGIDIKPAINSPHTEPWVRPIGALIINFGAIEAQSHFWLASLCMDREEAVTGMQLRFAQRTRLIRELMDQRIDDPEFVRRAADLWSEAAEVAKFRNAVAHASVMFAGDKDDPNKPPKFVIMPDFSHMFEKPPATPQRISLSDVESHVERAQAVALPLISMQRDLNYKARHPGFEFKPNFQEREEPSA